MYLRIVYFILTLFIISCSSTKHGGIGQLPDSFIEGFNVEDESISKFMGNKESTTAEVEKVETDKPVKEIRKKAAKKKIEKEKVDPKIVQLKKRYQAMDLKSKKVWSQFKPVMLPGEKYFFSVYFWGIRVGTVMLTLEEDIIVAGKSAYHLSGQFQSAKFYEYIYSFDDRLDTYIDKKKFVPLKYVLRQRESKQDVDDLQLFDHDKKKMYFLYKRIKKGKEKKKQKVAPIPTFFQDTFSTFFFIRGLPLRNGDRYQFPIMSRTKVKIFKIQVLKPEVIEVMDQEVEAIKFQASTFLPGVLKEKKGKVDKKKKDQIIFWFANDASRRFLKVEASVKLGSISGEVVGYCAAKDECVGEFYN